MTFRATAEAAQVKYLEWQLQDENLAVFHWDLLLQANEAALAQTTRQQYLARGQEGADSRETLMFWINQVGVQQTIMLPSFAHFHIAIFAVSTPRFQNPGNG